MCSTNLFGSGSWEKIYAEFLVCIMTILSGAHFVVFRALHTSQ